MRGINAEVSKSTLTEPGPGATIGRYRWWICALLFFATTINYVDRQVIGVLKPTLSADLGWSEIDYGTITFWFTAAYAAGYLFAGRLMDVIGVRLGYTLAVAVWSLAAMAHGLVRTVMGFSMARAVLGLAEGGNFPGAIKTIGEWFPKKERALATGIFNAGSNLGPIVTPLVVPWLTLAYGWPAAFLFTGAVGFVWLGIWLWVYRSPEHQPRLGAEELAFIRSDPPDPPERVPWLGLLRFRATWAAIVGMGLTWPVWWFYLFWLPDFLSKRFDLDLKTIGLPLVVVYLVADVGSIGGGWLSSALIRRGWSVNAARKTALVTCALLVVPVFFAGQVADKWAAVFLISMAAAGHQGWSANLYTFVSDTMPLRTVSSVVGMGGFTGAVLGMFNAKFVSYLLEKTQSNYTLLFALVPAMYLIAFFGIHLLVPRIERVQQEAR